MIFFSKISPYLKIRKKKSLKVESISSIYYIPIIYTTLFHGYWYINIVIYKIKEIIYAIIRFFNLTE